MVTERSTGIVCRWIGVGSLNPSSAKLRNKYDLQPYLLAKLKQEAEVSALAQQGN